MFFLSPLLLSISSNINTVSISSAYGTKKIQLGKFSILLLAILTSIGTLISMYIGKLLLPLMTLSIANLFGAVLLIYIGISFIVEYIRLEKKRAGYDTSYYFESSLNYKSILENPIIVDSDKSNHIDFKECLKLSFAIIFNNSCTTFAASITGVDIGLSVFFNFIITILSLYLGYFNSNIYISKWLSKYSNLVCGIVLVLFGIYEIFV
jgi:putative sporulation protein YtaF